MFSYHITSYIGFSLPSSSSPSPCFCHLVHPPFHLVNTFSCYSHLMSQLLDCFSNKIFPLVLVVNLSPCLILPNAHHEDVDYNNSSGSGRRWLNLAKCVVSPKKLEDFFLCSFFSFMVWFRKWSQQSSSPTEHWRVFPGVTEMESDCEEWRLLGGKCSTKQKRQSGLSWHGEQRKTKKREKERETKEMERRCCL